MQQRLISLLVAGRASQSQTEPHPVSLRCHHFPTQPRFSETVTHACRASAVWWDCVTEEESNPPAVPCLHLAAAFLSPPPALSQFFRLFYLLTASGTTLCFAKITLCATHCSTCVRSLFMQAHRLAFPSHGPFKFLLWQTDSQKRVIHTAWSTLSPTSLRAGTDKSAALPNRTLLQALVLCHVLTSHFGRHDSHGWLLAYRSRCVL